MKTILLLVLVSMFTNTTKTTTSDKYIITFRSMTEEQECFVQDTVVFNFKHDKIIVKGETDYGTFDIIKTELNRYWYEDSIISDKYYCKGYNIYVDKDIVTEETIQVVVQDAITFREWIYRF